MSGKIYDALHVDFIYIFFIFAFEERLKDKIRFALVNNEAQR